MKLHALISSFAGLWLVVLSGCTKTVEQAPITEVPAGSFIQAWAADLSLINDEVTAMDLVGDLVLVRTRNNTVFAISADGGTVRWATQVLPPGRSLGAPILVGDKIVFPTTGQLIVFNKLGTRVKEIELNRALRSGIVADSGFVYLGFDYGTQGRLGRVSIDEPYVPVRWELMNRGAVSAVPAVFENVIYSASEDGNVYAVTEERLPIWPLPGNVFATGGPILADVKADDTGVYISSTDSKLYALDRITGKIKWQFFAGVPLNVSPVITSDSVYQFVPGKGVVALDKTGGEYNRAPRWISSAGVAVIGSDADLVFLRGGDNSIFAIDKKTGASAFRTGRSDLAVVADEQSAGGLLFAATKSGRIMGVKPVKTGGTTGQLVQIPSVRQAVLGG